MFHQGMMATALLVLAAINAVAADFPKGPDPKLTPGAYCDTPSQRRYPEKIAYCNRNVSSQKKWQVIELYNQQLGFQIDTKVRGQFKIDHLIPLCAGGDNDLTNLWPQHESIYQITDPIEHLSCELMKAGKLKQSQAIQLILKAKTDLNSAGAVLNSLEAL